MVIKFFALKIILNSACSLNKIHAFFKNQINYYGMYFSYVFSLSAI